MKKVFCKNSFLKNIPRGLVPSFAIFSFHFIFFDGTKSGTKNIYYTFHFFLMAPKVAPKNDIFNYGNT
jgi:hypothetical protein